MTASGRGTRPRGRGGKKKKRLVLLGGGHAHVHVLRALGDAVDPSLDVTLVTPDERQLYSGMLPGYVAGHYRLDDCAIDLDRLARRAAVRLLLTTATQVKASRREVHCANGEVVPYDVLSLDVGSQTFIGDARGVTENAIAIRPLEQFAAQWEGVLKRVKSGSVRAVSLVGGGAAGVELAFAMDHRFRAESRGAAPHVRILTDPRGVLPEFARGVRARFRRLALERNIGTHGESPVAEVGADFLRLRNNMEFATDATFWVAGAAAPGFIRGSGFRTDKDGFLAVNAFLQSETRPEIFGVGDCATNPSDPRPKAGVFAVRAGPALLTNLLAALHGGPLKHHATSRRFLALVSCGGHYAVLAWGPLSLEGAWAWRWKDRIDRQFIAGFGAQALATSSA